MPPHRLRTVPPFLQVLLDAAEELRNTSLLDLVEGFPVDPGSSPFRLHPPPRFFQDVTPEDPIVQRVEAPLRAALGSHVQPALEFSHFAHLGEIGPHRAMPSCLSPRTSATKAGPLPSNGVVVAALIGTTGPSDSLPAPAPFALGL